MRRLAILVSITILVTGAGSMSAEAGPVFNAGSYSASGLALTSTASDSLMGLAYSGGHYYAVSGGTTSSPEQEYSASGTTVGGPTAPTPGIDFRSAFTDASGNVYVRGYNSNVIYKQTSFGNFQSYVTLSGTLDPQEVVVLNGAGTGYIGNDNGVVQEWDLAGNLTGTVTLQSFDTSYPQGRAIAAFGNYWLNYDSGVLTAYDPITGAAVDSATLVGAPTGTLAYLSETYANGYFWLEDSATNAYQSYQIGVPAADVPEPAPFAVLAFGAGALAFARRQKGAARLAG